MGYSLNRVPDSLISHRAVSGVTPGSASHRPKILFANDSPDEEADVVVGANGIRSVVKLSVTGDGKSDDYPAVYEQVDA